MENGAPGNSIFSQDSSVRSICTVGFSFLLTARGVTTLSSGKDLVGGLGEDTFVKSAGPLGVGGVERHGFGNPKPILEATWLINAAVVVVSFFVAIWVFLVGLKCTLEEEEYLFRMLVDPEEEVAAFTTLLLGKGGLLERSLVSSSSEERNIS